jgi:hypothetical protein
MRVPLTRSRGDETPIAWWEWLFTPVVVAAILLGCLAMIPYYVLYPEREAFEWDAGTERQREIMTRLRRRAARLSIWKRLGRVLTLHWCRRTLVRRYRARQIQARLRIDRRS